LSVDINKLLADYRYFKRGKLTNAILTDVDTSKGDTNIVADDESLTNLAGEYELEGLPSLSTVNSFFTFIFLSGDEHY